ncbi:MAG TPA: hypothetical protein VMS31_23425 [Pyrinomonadaceae bacterium]|nr:hypothetical protein [Pyrinomonadaceae bacterium]
MVKKNLPTPNSPPKVMAQPWYVKGKTFVFLWVMLLLLLCGGIATLFIRVPIYAQGIAVIVDGRTIPQYGHNEPVLVAFMPPETLPDLHVGRSLVFEVEKNQPLKTGSISAVESGLLKADAVEKQFNLSGGLGLALMPESAVVLARPEFAVDDSPERFFKRMVRVKVEVGTRRTGAFIPLINRLFEDN